MSPSRRFPGTGTLSGGTSRSPHASEIPAPSLLRKDPRPRCHSDSRPTPHDPSSTRPTGSRRTLSFLESTDPHIPNPHFTPTTVSPRTPRAPVPDTHTGNRISGHQHRCEPPGRGPNPHPALPGPPTQTGSGDVCLATGGTNRDQFLLDEVSPVLRNPNSCKEVSPSVWGTPPGTRTD